VFKVAVAWPLESVVLGEPDTTPLFGEKLTDTPGTAWFCASSTNAVMVAGLLPSDGICGALVMSEMLCWIAATVTTALAEALPLEAVTVIAVPAVAVPAVRVALATPELLVVADVTTSVPAVAVKTTAAPGTAVFPALNTVAVIVADVLPSAAIVDELVVTVIEATSEPPPLLLPPELELELELEVHPEVHLVIELPPQAASSQTAVRAINDNLRMSYILVRRLPCRGSN
jgi:hypothetical protein